MARNILIFSDGTGQAGGRTPDQDISNVYKLYRATRCDTDSTVDPNKQIAFYDAGLGTDPEGLGFFSRNYRRLRNLAGSALGLGVNQNIADCYATLVRTWRPGDRIYLIGFSRGAFTVRCVGGVIKMCGMPETAPGDKGLLRDRKSAEAIAKRAVSIYQYGARDRSKDVDPHKTERERLAAAFRKEFGSGSPEPGGASNAAPYFIGVFDTVGTISNMSSFLLIGVPLAIAAVLAILLWRELYSPMAFPLAALFAASLVALYVGGMLLYESRYGGKEEKNWRARLGERWKLLKPFKFYNAGLADDVPFARHALSIDENRDDFQPVLWVEDDSTKTMEGDAKRLRQVWFSGVHSDIGGSYPEQESRLSDITLEWMTTEMKALPEPPIFAAGRLHFFPYALGMQHDELKAVRGWIAGPRPDVAKFGGRVHETVAERFQAPDGVLLYDAVGPYRPFGLAWHPDYKKYYAKTSTTEPRPAADSVAET